MSRIEQIEDQIKELSSAELRSLEEWFATYQSDQWDLQLEADVNAGKLDGLAEKALGDHAAGRSSEL